MKRITTLGVAGYFGAVLSAQAQLVALLPAAPVTPASGAPVLALRLRGAAPGTGAVYFVGPGQLVVRQLYPLAAAPVATLPTNSLGFAAVADVDADGQDDVLVATPGSAGSTVQVYYQSAGTFALGSTLSLGTAYSPAAMAVADLNADGRPEVLLSNANTASSPTTQNQLAIVAGGPGRTFAAPVFLSRPHAAGAYGVPQLLVADLNADNKPDVAALYTSQSGAATTVVGLGVSLGTNSATTLGTEQVLGLSSAYPSSVVQPYVAIADFDRDGRADVAYTDRTTGTSSSFYNLLVAAGSAAGVNLLDAPQQKAAFSARSTTAISGLALGDFNNDTYTDIVVNLSDQISIIQVAGPQTPGFSAYYFANTAALFGNPAVLQLDGNAYADLLVGRNGDLLPLLNGGPLASRHELARPGLLYPNPSAGTFTLAGGGHGLHVTDALGRAVPATLLLNGQVQLEQAAPGLYQVGWLAADQQPRHAQLLVR